MSWQDNLVAKAKVENADKVDNDHLGAAVAFLKSEGIDPVEASTLDHIMSKASKESLTVEQLKAMNSDLANIYFSEIWR